MNVLLVLDGYLFIFLNELYPKHIKFNVPNWDWVKKDISFIHYSLLIVFEKPLMVIKIKQYIYIIG
jgi:hypothetical protein